jgi:hypothetical protein
MESGETPRNSVLLTGLPRSGTTLTCHLLNKLPNTVALHEPLVVGELGRMATDSERMQGLNQRISDIRRELLGRRRLVTKHIGGRIPDNTFSSDVSQEGGRKSIAVRGEVHFEKPLDDRFQLVIKHPSFFSAILPLIRDVYPCFAVIRNPLSVLGSWNSVDMAIQRGHIPTAERVDTTLRRALASHDDVFDRQFLILEWFLGRFLQYLPPANILRYEDTVGTGGKSLQVINPDAATLGEKLESRNRSELYQQGILRRLGERLLESEGPWWEFYSRDDVRVVMEE